MKFYITIIVAIYLVSLSLIVGNHWVKNLTAHQGVSGYDGTVACQQIASQATNSGWSYSNCIKEMQKATAPTAVSYQT